MSLATISSDGKILIWNDPMRTLRYPIKGHILSKMKNNKLQIQGGTNFTLISDQFGLDENVFIVGT